MHSILPNVILIAVAVNQIKSLFTRKKHNSFSGQKLICSTNFCNLFHFASYI